MRLLLKVIKQGQVVPEEKFVKISAGDGIVACYKEDEEESSPSEEETVRLAQEELDLRRAQFDAILERDRSDAEEAARQIRAQAEQEREQILEQAKKSAIQMIEEGRLEGIHKGIQEKTAEIDAMLKKMNAVLEELKQDQLKFFQSYAAQTQDFALEIAGKILHEQITLDPASMENLIIESIGTVRDADWLTVKLSNRSGELIKLLNDYYHQSDARKIAFTENRSAPGTCIVDTPDGTIDASIQTQLDNLRQLFQKAARK